MKIRSWKSVHIIFVAMNLGILFSESSVKAQGISFSYLIPNNGYVSAPVSPFSIRGVGFQVAPSSRDIIIY